MGIVQSLSTLALRPILDGACQALGVAASAVAADRIVGKLSEQFTDHSQRLSLALGKANDHAWKTLEIALAGESLWSCLDRAEHKALRRQIREFLDATPLDLPGPATEARTASDFRRDCLRELRAARKAGHLTPGKFEPAALAQKLGALARFTAPEAMVQAEWQLLDEMAGELRAAGYPSLARLVGLRPAHGVPLLAGAARYFFRRAVETDRELFQGLAWSQLEALQKGQHAGFDALSDVLTTQSQGLEEMLGTVQEYVIETHSAVLDVQAEQHRQGAQMKEIYDAVMDLKRRHDLRPSGEVRARDSLSISNESERRAVKGLVRQFRELPASQRRAAPALINSLAQLEVGAGDFEAAQQDFQEVAGLLHEAKAQAAALHNAYWAALERRDWQAALDYLRRAAELDPERCAPFPFAKYQPERILGAGGFGVAFLCKHRNLESRIVIKALRTDGLERDVRDVFAEARVLEELDHRAIIRVRDCDHADAARTRPYLVMDYFDGVTLEEHVARHGPLTPEDLLGVFIPVAEGLEAAHGQGILHRDIKPANLLVRRVGEPGASATGGRWRVKVIDFGLAMKRTLLADTSASLSSHNRTVVGESIAGSVHYAAPEQMGQLPGVAVGPYTDVYAFGKTCCHALFKTTAPLPKHWRSLPAPLADLLEQCLNERPEERLPGFRAVLERLQQLHSPAAKSPPPSVAEPPRPTAKPPAPPPSEDGGTWLEAAFGGLFAPVEKVAKATLGGLFGKGETGASQAPKGLTVQAAPANLRDLEKRIGESFYFEVTGDPNGLLWGTDVYTSDSSPATAAVHAGIVRAGEKGVVQVTLVKPLSSYAGTTRNGVTSRPWESWPGAFRIAAVPVVERATPARLWKVGDRVLAPWGREWWYAGTVQEQKADHVRVKFDDGDEGWSAAGLVRPLAFAVGAKVHARSKDEADYRPGWVVREQQHDLLIQFEGGGQDWRPLKWVRVAPLV